MNLLDEIRADLMSETARLPNTLRKVSMLPRELQSQELEEWVASELNGYRQADTVPNYRRINLPVYGTFHGPFQSRKPDVVITTAGLPEHIKGSVDTLIVTEGIDALERMLASNEAGFHRTFPPELTALLRRDVQMSGGMVLFEAYQRIPRYLFEGVVDAAKNRLLGFVRELQEKNMTPKNLNNDTDGQDVVRDVVVSNITNNIHGNNNSVVVASENVHQEVKPINKGDAPSLIEHLRDHNISHEDLSELGEAVVSEPNATSSGFGPKVNAWLGKMTAKAISGTWQAGVSNAPAMLVEAIQKFYGS